MNIDKNARYRASHEYARKDGAEMVSGISDHAQSSLGDIVFVELPEVGKKLRQGEAFGVVGVLLSLPASAVGMVVIQRLLKRYHESDFYRA